MSRYVKLQKKKKNKMDASRKISNFLNFWFAVQDRNVLIRFRRFFSYTKLFL